MNVSPAVRPAEAERHETCANWLALLTLAALGIVWPFADVTGGPHAASRPVRQSPASGPVMQLSRAHSAARAHGHCGKLAPRGSTSPPCQPLLPSGLG